MALMAALGAGSPALPLAAGPAPAEVQALQPEAHNNPPTPPSLKAPPPWHDGLRDLLVLIRPGIPEASAYANALEKSLWKELGARQIRCLVLVDDPQQGNAAEIASQIARFHPQWRMTWTEQGASLSRKQVYRSNMQIQLAREGDPNPRWVKEIAVSSSVALSQEKLARDAVDALLLALEILPKTYAPDSPYRPAPRNKLSKTVKQGRLLDIKRGMDAGEPVDARDRWGWTPLLWAIWRGDTVMLKWFLMRRADPNLASGQPLNGLPVGTTPLGLASRLGHEGMISPLIEAGASLSVTDSQGHTPRELAAGLGRPALLQILDTPRGTNTLDQRRPVNEGLQDLYILIRSSAPGPRTYLSHLRTLLEAELQARHIRGLVHLEDLLGVNAEHRAVQLRSFRPAYQLTWEEREVTFTRDSRRRSVMAGKLGRTVSEPVWSYDTIAESGIILDDRELAEQAVFRLFAALETEGLLPPQTTPEKGR